MEQLTTLSTFSGREALQRVYFSVLERTGTLSLLATMLRVCTGSLPIAALLKTETSVQHPLGFFRGLSLFMQEIVYKHYLSSIHSLVYFGAAVLLTIVGLYRFTESVSEPLVVGAVILEAALLGLLFVVGMFSPPDYAHKPVDTESEIQQLVREVGEISADYAGFSMQVDTVTQALGGIQQRMDELIASVNEMSRAATAATSPPSEMLEVMHSTTESLRNLQTTVIQLVKATDDIKDREVRLQVRAQLEDMLQTAARVQTAQDSAQGA